MRVFSSLLLQLGLLRPFFWRIVHLRFAVLCMLVLGIGSGFSSEARADAVAGQTLYTNNGCTGCHSMHKNAAFAPNVISYAITNTSQGQMAGFSTLTAQERSDIADYIGSQTSSSMSKSVSYNTAASFSIPDIDLSYPSNSTTAFSSISTVSAPTKGNVSFSGTTATYTPTNGQYGSDSFTYQASGAGGSSSVRTVNITIANPPAPTATGGSMIASFGTSTTLDVASKISGVYTTVTIGTDGSHGHATVSGTTITYTPGNYVGSDSFTFVANGPGGASAPATISVSDVAPLPPTVSDRSATVPINVASAIDLTGFITGAFSGATVVTAPAHGSATFSGKIATYTPAPGYFGADSFTYNATGLGGTSVIATVTITVVQAPTVSAKSATISFNTTTQIDMDASISGAHSSVAVATQPAHGTASASGTKITYTPTSGYIGADSLTYIASGVGGTSTPGTLSITVLPPAPTTSGKSVTVAFETATAIDLTASVAGTATAVSIAGNPTHGTATASGYVVTYTPATSYVGTDSFTYAAVGPGGTSTPATVTVTVTSPPPPSANSKSVLAVRNTPTPIDMTSSVVGRISSLAISTPPAHGNVLASGSIITYTPATDYVGSDSFSYVAINPGGTSAPATVSITVAQMPVAVAASMSVPLNTPTTLDLGTVVTGTGVTGIAIAGRPAHGTVTLNGTKVTYAPVNNYFGTDAFTYVVFGNAGTSPPGIVSVTVTGRPDPSKDAAVSAIAVSQVDAARRFSRAQISNFQGRMETLHRHPSDTSPDVGSAQLAPAPSSIHAAAGGVFGGDQDNHQQQPARPTGAAYQPAASLTNNPSAGLEQARAATPAQALLALASAMNGNGAPQEASLAGKVLSTAVNTAQGSTLNLAASTNEPGKASADDSGIDMWIGGSIKFGSRDPNSSNGFSYTSDGVSVGVDKRVNDKLAIGVGFGYARDTTTVGTDGTNSRGKSFNLAAYGSYQPTSNTYIDGLVGFGRLNYDMNRFVAPISDFARSQRSGDFVFGSLTAGYEFRAQGLNFSPYGRLDLAEHRLNGAVESGAAPYALVYGSQNIPSMQMALGLRADAAHESAFGWVTPRMRVEFQHEFKGDQAATFSYADQIGGPSYALPADASSRNSIVLGVGSDIFLGRGLKMSLDYQLQRFTGQERAQALYVKLTKDLDGNAAPKFMGSGLSFGSLGLKIDVGGTYDDNVTRASTAANIFADYVYSLNVSKNTIISTGTNTRAILNGFVGAERYRTYSGLGNVYIGGDAELQYRASGDFAEPIWGLFGNLTAVNYDSDLRDGYRYALGVNVREALTDCIAMFGALAFNGRKGRSNVFTGHDWSGKLNFDYELAPNRTLYATGEYRYGDVVALGSHTLANINIAKMFVEDDVFVRNDLYAYRFEGSTKIITLGYNYSLGTKDSFDFSWRRALSTPKGSTGLVGIGTPSYKVNQFSIVYLTSF